MARARNIKPGFFRNADLVELSFEARLLFIGLWTLCDREGRLEDRPKQIKMEIFPADSVDCDAMLNDLAAIGVVERYEVDGKRYIQVSNFAKHQNPHHMEAPSEIPPPPGCSNRYNHLPVSPKQRARIYERDEHKCTLCGCLDDLHIDHIVQVAHGGTSDDDNLRTLCAQCNNKRSKAVKSEANPADSLIPDSLIPDSLIPESKNTCAAEQRVSGMDGFDQFYSDYPKKRNRGDAEKAWKSLKPNAEVLAKILSGLADAANSEDWKKENGKYIPYPASWLRAKGWEDEIVSSSTSAKPKSLSDAMLAVAGTRNFL